MKPLETVLTEIEEQEQEVVYQPFRVTDLETAAEASRRIAYFDEKQKEIDSIIETQIAPFLAKIEKIKEWGVEAKKEFVEKQQFYSDQLEFYLREEVAKQVEAGKKPKKTISLPHGKISLKKQQPEFVKNDEELFSYAKSTGFIKVKESTDWVELKKKCSVYDGKLIDENGEVVPGVTVVERNEKFEIKLD
ncbi:host-nuclease inhibitor Gam family protein [Robertmurraya sp. DFI.2.37]|uniref:host-nuclease inhibitor Gam family protein n=1 Tax=Robertmurraya sp. DFI.2.37 TaxID=3031819 RepID=UPI001CDA3B7D|nr:host-nuclease inhibitor Gam family protein [Robertmurraya sp. DFI.2.37]MDF1510530.1 host-nuclease inhibitor Gam family protein [Robertmurraya sp. DFI.2.37]